MDWALLRTVYRELTQAQGFMRIPERELVMSDEASVSAYARGGRADGALAGTYLYHLAQMCELVGPGDLVLDLGCGPCSLLAQLAWLNPRAEFIGVDLSEGMLRQAAALLRQRGITNVELRRRDMTSLRDVPDASMDVVVSSMSLHHLPDLAALDRTFAEVARVLKPEGRLYLSDFGRLKSLRSVDYFVSRAAEGEEPALAEDYAQSLRAAFSREEFEALMARHLAGRARLYSTAISSLLVVVKGGTPRQSRPYGRELGAMFRALPRARKNDVRQMEVFLRLGGLRSAL